MASRDYDSAFDSLWDEQEDDDDTVVAATAGDPDDSAADDEEEEPDAFFFGISHASVGIRFDHTPSDRQFLCEWDDEYEPDAELMEKLAICIRDDQPVVMVGPKGCGKTSAIQALAAATKQPLRRINLTAHTRVRDFVGYRTLDYEEDEDGEVRQVIRWVDGILPAAMRAGHWLLIDEIDAAPPGVTLALQAVLEPARQLVLAENSGEPVKAPGKTPGQPSEPDKRRFRIFATANTLGFGDDTGFYAGTNVMNQATMDRFAVISTGYPDLKTELGILKSRTGLSKTVLRKMVEFAKKIRDAVDLDECGISVSTRQLVQWGKMTASIFGEAPSKFVFPATDNPTEICQYALMTAYAMNVAGKLPDEDNQFYSGVFQREFGFAPGKP